MNKLKRVVLFLMGALTISTLNSCQREETPAELAIASRNREVVRRLIDEGLNRKNSNIALELAAANFVDGDAFPNQPNGPEGLKFHFDVINRNVPDLRVEFTLVTEGNTVVEEWTGRGNLVNSFETGQRLPQPVPIMQNGVTIFTLNGEGRITERRTFQRGEQ